MPGSNDVAFELRNTRRLTPSLQREIVFLTKRWFLQPKAPRNGQVALEGRNVKVFLAYDSDASKFVVRWKRRWVSGRVVTRCRMLKFGPKMIIGFSDSFIQRVAGISASAAELFSNEAQGRIARFIDAVQENPSSCELRQITTRRYAVRDTDRFKMELIVRIRNPDSVMIENLTFLTVSDSSGMIC